MMKKTFTPLLLLLAVFVGISLACNLPGSSSANLPPTAQPMSTQEMQGLQEEILATLQNPAANGDVVITLTQAQVNAIITSEMAKQPDKLITDPSVVLTEGNMEIYGKVTQSGISANLKVVLQPSVSADGSAKMNVSSISLGGIPVPDVLKNRINEAADNALSSYLSNNQTGLRAKSIVISAGQMTITGTRQ